MRVDDAGSSTSSGDSVLTAHVWPPSREVQNAARKGPPSVVAVLPATTTCPASAATAVAMRGQAGQLAVATQGSGGAGSAKGVHAAASLVTNTDGRVPAR